jgi:heme/copper-type cytochrome/quinol oxidase subunit 2
MKTTQLLNIFAPESTPTGAIVDLSVLVLSITAVIFVVVAGLLVYTIVKFRATPANADREPAQVYGSTQIELAWTIVPILIVIVLFAATARVIHAIQDAPRPPTAVEVTVIGHQFWWEYRYPALGVVTANELHVPVSDPSRPRPTVLTLLSADTDHSFWIPQLAGKTDLIPNRSTSVDGSASTGHLSRPVRAVLRDAARQDAAARVGRYARRIRRVDSRAARARDGGRIGDRRQTSLRNDRLHQLSHGPWNGGERAVRSRPDALDEPRHARVRRRREHAGESAPVAERSRRDQARLADAGHETVRAELDALVRYMQSLR